MDEEIYCLKPTFNNILPDYFNKQSQHERIASNFFRSFDHNKKRHATELSFKEEISDKFLRTYIGERSEIQNISKPKKKGFAHEFDNIHNKFPNFGELSNANTKVKSYGKRTGNLNNKAQKIHFDINNSNNETKLNSNNFQEIEKFSLNVGSTKEGMNLFLEKVEKSKLFSLVIIWDSMVSSHISTSSKLCTPSSKCFFWYCSCEKNVKSLEASKNIFCVLLAFPGEENSYFIPLSENKELSHPIICKTTLSERWNFLVSVLTCDATKIIFNSQLSYLPILKLLSKFHLSRSNYTVDLFRNFFDVKIAFYLINNDLKESDLELYSIFEKFAIDIANPNHFGIGSFTRLIIKLKLEMDGLFLLYENLYKSMKEMGSLNIFSKIEMPLVSLLSKMELNGIFVSKQVLDGIQLNVQRKKMFIETLIFQQSGEEFNVSSPDQVSKIVYGKLKLPPPLQNSKKGKHYSTAEEDLQKIQHLHPIIELILNYRTLNKILTTYIEGINNFLVLMENDDVNDGFDNTSSSEVNGELKFKNSKIKSPTFKVHAQWNHTSVRTGRLSCSRPNLQNIPNSQSICGININIRSAFEAPRGSCFISADYSQIEIRVLAHLCGDSKLIQLFQQKGDIYKNLASVIFNKSQDAVTEDERSKSKVICLGVLYGMGGSTSAQKLGLDVPTANKIINSFFSHFAQIKNWMNSIKSQAKKLGFVQTILGRIRRLSLLNAVNDSQHAMLARQSVNSVVQGSASDIIKLAMLNIEKNCSENDDIKESANFTQICPNLHLQIHDELVYSVPNEKNTIEKFKEIISYSMTAQIEQQLKLRIPLDIKIKSGNNLGNLIAIQS